MLQRNTFMRNILEGGLKTKWAYKLARLPIVRDWVRNSAVTTYLSMKREIDAVGFSSPFPRPTGLKENMPLPIKRAHDFKLRFANADIYYNNIMAICAEAAGSKLTGLEHRREAEITFQRVVETGKPSAPPSEELMAARQEDANRRRTRSARLAASLRR